MKKSWPRMRSDRAAKEFLKRDLSDYIHSGNFKPISFEFEPKTRSVTLRLSEGLFQTLKETATKQGIHYQRLVRLAIEAFLRKAAA